MGGSTPKGKARGECVNVLPERDQNENEDACSPVYRLRGERDKERNSFRNAIQKETPGSTTALVALSRRSTLALFSRSVSSPGFRPVPVSVPPQSGSVQRDCIRKAGTGLREAIRASALRIQASSFPSQPNRRKRRARSRGWRCRARWWRIPLFGCWLSAVLGPKVALRLQQGPTETALFRQGQVQ